MRNYRKKYISTGYLYKSRQSGSVGLLDAQSHNKKGYIRSQTTIYLD